jgi:hypothetical protein
MGDEITVSFLVGDVNLTGESGWPAVVDGRDLEGDVKAASEVVDVVVDPRLRGTATGGSSSHQIPTSRS